MKIIHITEALGGGVMHSLAQLAKVQASDGHHVIVVHSVRKDTPLELLSDLYPESVERRELVMVSKISPVADLFAFVQIYALLKAENASVIHLHSSKAGMLGRLAAYFLRKSNRVFYSPRGFSFLRSDISFVRQMLFLSLERFASKLGGSLIACSRSEADLSRLEVKHPRTRLVENSVDLRAVQVAHGLNDSRLRVITSGRICYQKAPWRFRDIVMGCADLPADFIWLGDGDLHVDLMVNGEIPSNLKIAGWQPRERVYASLAGSDVFVMTSLWEGMPLALIEAQAAGLPAVVSNIVGNRDVVIDGETGFICDSDETLILKVRLLIEDALLRKRMGWAARKMVAKRFGVDRMHREMMVVYEEQAGQSMKCDEEC